MVNDGVYANSLMKIVFVSNVPHLCLFATKSISVGTEIRYNYGDKKNLWWRKKVRFHFLYI